MTYFGGPQPFVPRPTVEWAKDIFACILTVIFVWLCVGPGLDYVCAALGMPLR